ncbi:uncharacterized protein BDR25DRAFT_319557 [Lindgomyces ingoldianus]|uniref:Uncharacterized protein n=1 Tax=Lindgomyces ingoldianus TaxID=673940 RepID=A0ACB6QAG2_9PLEO|nr:uncharacterized protein BDR25DRAFT_319557 [Lindgomyces ingoldianus]KAF2463954.1 hypothetical protein BDR25DRAFT_319557 [Lindgomyces ingoldianus]
MAEMAAKQTGYLLKPSIEACLSSNLRIADIGTGTGKFLQRLSESYPTALLGGLDISPALYPPSGTLPSNISLKVLDIKQPIPNHLVGIYDVVYARMLAAAIQPNEWGNIVRNISYLLRPGGYLQWEEYDFVGVKHLRGGYDSRVETARFMGRLFRDALKENFAYGWNILAEKMQAAGFISIETDIVSSDRVPQTRERLSMNGMRAIFSWAHLRTVKGAPGSHTREEIEQYGSGSILRHQIRMLCEV